MTTVPDCRDICPNLGFCCRSFGIGIATHFKVLLPFLTLQKLHELCNLPDYMVPVKRDGDTLIVKCTMVDDSGLCSIYEDRPKLCRDYKPYTNAVCCLWIGYSWQCKIPPLSDSAVSSFLLPPPQPINDESEVFTQPWYTHPHIATEHPDYINMYHGTSLHSAKYIFSSGHRTANVFMTPSYDYAAGFSTGDRRNAAQVNEYWEPVILHYVLPWDQFKNQSRLDVISDKERIFCPTDIQSYCVGYSVPTGAKTVPPVSILMSDPEWMSDLDMLPYVHAPSAAFDQEVQP